MVFVGDFVDRCDHGSDWRKECCDVSAVGAGWVVCQQHGCAAEDVDLADDVLSLQLLGEWGESGVDAFGVEERFRHGGLYSVVVEVVAIKVDAASSKGR